MTAVFAVMEKYNKIIIFSLVGVIALFLFACTFNDVLPICHWIFGCDHMVAHLSLDFWLRPYGASLGTSIYQPVFLHRQSGYRVRSSTVNEFRK